MTNLQQQLGGSTASVATMAGNRSALQAQLAVLLEENQNVAEAETMSDVKLEPWHRDDTERSSSLEHS